MAVIRPSSVNEVAAAAVIEKAIGPAVQAAVRDPTVPGISENPAEGARVAQAISQAMAKEGWISGFRKRFGSLTFGAFLVAAGAIMAALELIHMGSNWEPIAGALGAALLASAPIIEAIHPPTGAFVRRFFARS